MKKKRHFYLHKTVDSPPFEVGHGHPLPLGATLTHDGINFSVFSRHGISVTLILYDSKYKKIEEIPLDPFLNKTGDIWHILVYYLDPSISYGFRVDGPYDPRGAGHRFNRDIVLIDPYTRALTDSHKWGDEDELIHSEVENYLKRASCVV
ncbi:MAG: hypothetical protein D6828_06090, partial [Nitrospirae bacterium]